MVEPQALDEDYQENPRIEQLIIYLEPLAHKLGERITEGLRLNKDDVTEYVLLSMELIGLLLEDNNRYSEWSEGRAREMFGMMQQIAEQNDSLKRILATHGAAAPPPKHGNA